MKIVFSLILAVSFFSLLKIGLERQERAECIKWQAEAREFPLWFSPEWQRAQCRAHNLPLPH